MSGDGGRLELESEVVVVGTRAERGRHGLHGLIREELCIVERSFLKESEDLARGSDA